MMPKSIIHLYSYIFGIYYKIMYKYKINKQIFRLSLYWDVVEDVLKSIMKRSEFYNVVSFLTSYFEIFSLIITTNKEEVNIPTIIEL